MPYPAKLTLDALTTVAVRIADAAGLPAVGIRSVADALEVRPSALYRHCGDATGLTALIAEHSAAELRTAVLQRLSSPERDAEWRFLTMARAYQAYAAAHPARYAALMTDTTHSVWPAQPGVHRKALWNLLLEVVGALTGASDDTPAAVAVWSYLHGYAALGATGMFGASGPQDGFERGLLSLCRGLRTPA